MQSKTISMDPAYFYEKAVRYMERYQYEKAVKYFRRITELEPQNPVHFCNLAGALAECGKYDESNQLLTHVLESFQPEMTECHFYMANNYTNLEQWELAEIALMQYLSKDEEGYYLEDCQEMLAFFVDELGRAPLTISQVKSRQGYAEHDDARKCLEEGHFEEAIYKLNQIIEWNPDFIPAYNNLALAYFYVGEYERARQAVQEVLAKEANNLHALCNLAILLQHEGDMHQRNLLVMKLSKIKPLYSDQIFKLATTMGMLEEHKLAYQLFHSLEKKHYEEIANDSCFYHYHAVAAFNIRLIDEAYRCWNIAKEISPTSDVAHFYFDHAENWMSVGKYPNIKLKYHYQLPLSEHLRLLHERSKGNDITNEMDEQFLYSSFEWAIQKGKPELKKIVLDSLELLKDPMLEKLH